MKNIHILPTDKPSRLQLFEGINEFEFELCSKDSFFKKGVHIYITSDEEIKEGGWCINIENNLLHWVNEYKDNSFLKNCKKIILTTDEDLIKDGVQAIDDEFLEWFVKNPSCEEIEVERFYSMSQSTHSSIEYKIIIPKEEQKQHLIDMMKADEELGLYEEPKQETLEEAAEKWYDSTEENKGFPKIKAFKDGAEWQIGKQERSYSEEEVNSIFYAICKHSFFEDNVETVYLQDVKDEFEQFKKK